MQDYFHDFAHLVQSFWQTEVWQDQGFERLKAKRLKASGFRAMCFKVLRLAGPSHSTVPEVTRPLPAGQARPRPKSSEPASTALSCVARCLQPRGILPNLWLRDDISRNRFDAHVNLLLASQLPIVDIFGCWRGVLPCAIAGTCGEDLCNKCTELSNLVGPHDTPCSGVLLGAKAKQFATCFSCGVLSLHNRLAIPAAIFFVARATLVTKALCVL